MNLMRGKRAVRAARALLPVAVLVATVAADAGAAEQREVLGDGTMDGLRAGAAYAGADLAALAPGDAFRTRTDARTSVFARGVVQRGAGGGRAYAAGNDGASTRGAGLSQLDGIAAAVDGGARASGAGAFTETRLDTRVIDTPAYALAVGRVRSTACCSPDSATYASGSTALDGAMGFDHVAQRQSDGPVLTRSEVYVVSARYRLPAAGKR